MNIFSDDRFLNAFCQVYFPAQTATSEWFELGGKLWKLPTHQGQPIPHATFIDFFEPCDTPVKGSQPNARHVPYLLRTSHGIVPCSQWFEQSLAQQFDPSPTILWQQFASWEDFTHYAKQKRFRLFSDTRRKQSRLEKELGTLQFIYDDRRPGILETCFQWKSQQLDRQGLPNPFKKPEHLQLFQALIAQQILLISSLGTEDSLLAIHISLLDRGRLYWWVTAYNTTYAQYSPGKLLLHFLLKESFQQQHTEFDFLWGNEDYKWHYATHVRLIADLGVRPLPKQLKHWLKTTLRPFPQVSNSLKQLHNKMLRSTLE